MSKANGNVKGERKCEGCREMFKPKKFHNRCCSVACGRLVLQRHNKAGLPATVRAYYPPNKPHPTIR